MIEQYVLINGLSIIGKVVKEKKHFIILKEVYMIYLVQKEEGEVFYIMQPYTLQSFEEDLPTIKLFKDNIIASHRPSEKTYYQYLNTMEERFSNIDSDDNSSLTPTIH